MQKTSAAPAIRIRNLVKRYGSVTAVDGLDLDIAPGSVTALLGGNGAGKTTTIAMIMGLLLPTSGSIEVLGHDMLTSRYRVLARMNFESPYVEMPLRLTVRQNLTVFGRLYGVAGLAARIDALARELELSEFLGRPVGKLSAGQKTRVSLAKSLVNEPDLLLLDEPTASLDPDTADWVRSHIERYCAERGATVLLASHNMGEVERMASRVLMMKAGKIVDDDTPSGLLARYGRQNLEEVFLDIARSPVVRASQTEPVA
ncbi:MAG: ABC transporter ATP-binding protein [Tepidamorphaceae bacterium]|nr:ABC transporter ATP-binding protein [Rhodobiaceae bacterium]MCC0049551.1 ABC transporter ATP-binding protein [Rhodobiaceae bacterium]